MKKIYFLLFCVFNFMANAQIVNIPDANFKNLLLNSSTNNIASDQPVILNNGAWSTSGLGYTIDTNGDGEIQISEAELVTFLNIGSSFISDLTGIESFINLQYLDCHFNQLTNLNISGINNLKIIDCSINQLLSLDVSNKPQLFYLSCFSNSIGNLDISQSPTLEILDCGYNLLTELDVSQNPYLKTLWCHSNQLQNLDITQNTALKRLSCSNNSLTSIDASQNTQLEELDCPNNLLQNLNVSNNLALKVLGCSNNFLTGLDVSQSNVLEILECYENELTSLLVNSSSLKELRCYSNQITALDVSQSSVLEILECYSNQLTSLNVISPVLVELPCYENQLTSLNVSQCNLLKNLDCHQNLLTNLDVQNTILDILNCGNNQLTSLDVSQNPDLIILACSNNQLTGIDVSQNPDLGYLYCGNNQLTGIDVSQNIILEYLECNNNQLTSIDVFQNPALTGLDLSNNQLTNLDVSQNPALIGLDLSNNQLTNLDVSQNPALFGIVCNNNLFETLYLKNGNTTPWSLLDFSNNPNLEYICADEEDIDLVQQNIDTYGYTSTCHVNSYCSFTPNGTFYQITGNTKFDFNNNGCDTADIDYTNLRFNINDGVNTGSFITNETGVYSFSVQAGNHTVTPVLENPTYFNISPTSFTVDFPTQTIPFAQDFCVTANGMHSDVEVVVIPTTPARPGFDAVYKIIYKNKGNQVENGSVSLTFDDAVLDYLYSNPVYNNSATNSFSWNYTNLQPFETREIEISFNVNSPTETPAVNNGDILNYTATITTATTDEMSDDNIFELNQTVVGSYDPNDKTCLEGETVDVSMVGEYVHYVIRFENTGTYPAENIVVKDMIDISKFDVSTLVPLHGSHEFYTRIKDNKVEFIFENINLDFNDATNDGYVAFKIKTLPTLTVGDTFTNDANIYFDYNFPITTNTYTTTVNNVLNNQDFAFENEFTLYPNPAKEILNISSKIQTEIQSVEIYNIVGQIVVAIPNTTKTIDVSSLETGTYFVKVNTERGSATTKFIKE